jgi:hypothetical protein
MDDKQIQYYFEMKKRGRLIHLTTEFNGNGILTYFIGNGVPEKYQKRDMWSIIEDEPNGDTIYCDQLITGHSKLPTRIAIGIWRDIKRYFKSKYPNIDKIRWVRVKRHNNKEE